VQQINRASDVGVDDVFYRVKVLIQEAMPQAMPGVGKQRINWSPWAAA